MTVGDYLAAVAKLPRRSDCGRTALWWDLDRGYIRIDEHGAVTERPPDSRIKPTAAARHPVRNSPRPRLANQAGLNQVARAVYRETGDFYKRIKPKLKDAAAFGFRVLYGPPTLRPPIMFIGIRPGGSSPDPAHPDEQRTWPATSDYAESSWNYAAKLRRIYSSGYL